MASELKYIKKLFKNCRYLCTKKKKVIIIISATDCAVYLNTLFLNGKYSKRLLQSVKFYRKMHAWFII